MERFVYLNGKFVTRLNGSRKKLDAWARDTMGAAVDRSERFESPVRGMFEMVYLRPVSCEHPPSRLYAGFSDGEDGGPVMWVACCDCGAVLK